MTTDSQADLDRMFCPQSVAIIGASDDPDRISGRALRYIRQGGFKGPIYPINSRRDIVQGLKAYPALENLPEVPDVVLIALPLSLAQQAVKSCADFGVKAAIIFTGGFAETGEAGAQAQAEIKAIAAAARMRLLGPNCLGMFNSELGFFALFASSLDRGLPPSGPAAVVSQSGAYGQQIAYLAQRRGLGVKYCITTGNEADVSVADALMWVAGQPDIRVIMAYAEGIRNGPAFVRALEVAQRNGKQIVFVKVGRSERGAQAVASHTAALAGADEAFDAVLRQFGAYRADSTDEQIDVAYVCARGAPLSGRRLGILTVSGGFGVQICDAAISFGLDVPPLPESAKARLSRILPTGSVLNPVDCTGQVVNDTSIIAESLDLMLAEGGYDAVIAFFSTLPLAASVAENLRRGVMEGIRNHADRLVVLCTVADSDSVRAYEKGGLLVFEDPVRAVRAVAAAMRLTASKRASSDVGDVAVEPASIGQGPVSEFEAKRLLADALIPVPSEHLVASRGAAVEAAQQCGSAVAMKIVSPDILHKTEIGGVILNVSGDAAVGEAFDTLMRRAHAAMPSARIDGVLVTPMAPRGVETIIGIKGDPTFGPLVMFGLGGVFVEVFKDVAFRLAPINLEQAHEMITEVKGRALLEGARGAGRSDIDAVASALVNASKFAAANADRIESVDINPFLVLPAGQGALALDAAIVPREPASG